MIGARDGEVNDGVKVSLFDESVENHFKALETISNLCGENQFRGELLQDSDEIEGSSDNIAFLREWKQFKYPAREIRFATGSSPCRNDNDVIVLPPFSSASVPQPDDGVTGSSTQSSKDFVLYVGGSVWALDWCPHFLCNTESSIRCEFLAVAAHPPDSYYHKMGVPLCGRGMVQIWCLLNIDENAQSFKKSGESKFNDYAKGKRRPGNNIDQSSDQISVKRPRGRPRKAPIVADPHAKEPKDSLDVVLLLDYPTKEIETSKRNRVQPKMTAKTSKVSCLQPMTESSEIFTPDANADSYFDDTLELHELEKVCTHSQGNIRQVSYQKKKIDDSSDNIVIKRPRGRPRKVPIVDIPAGSGNMGSSVVSSIKSHSIASTLFRRTIVEEDDTNSFATLNRCEGHFSTSLNEQTRERRLAPCSTSKDSEFSTITTQIDCDASSSFEEITENHFISTEVISTRNATQCDGTLTCTVPNDVVLPRMVFCLAHNGKVVWDMKWRRRCASDPCHSRHLGYLAVLLGNGTLEVWDVPIPSKTKKYFYSKYEEGQNPRFVKLKPVFKCSRLKCGDTLSIPLTMEWSNQDEILVGCHDGTVALWKFFRSANCDDTRPFLCFSADTVPIRAVAWNPVDSDHESANVILTAGHVGLKFWDIRDPYRPLWDLHPVPRYIYSIDWLADPKCIMLSFDDGTMRLLSLVKSAYDAPVHGHSTVGPKQYGLHAYTCSSFAIWSVHVSRHTGMVAYCSADGSVSHFQLTSKAVEKDPGRHRTPHYCCSLLSENGSSITIDAPLNKTGDLLNKKLSSRGESDKKLGNGGLEKNHLKGNDSIENMPSKMVAMQRVRWNMNRGSERWLCSGGAAGIVRLQEIVLSDSDLRLAKRG